MSAPPRWRLLLALALLALALLYAAWMWNDRDRLAALLVFALPPLLFALAVLRGGARAPFWAGVAALAWFSHAVMIAWAHPPQRGPAALAIALALAVVLLSAWPALAARRKP
ncbi:MAG: DUF2069 domain-containing protein [Pseudoxanthomonas sp.]